MNKNRKTMLGYIILGIIGVVVILLLRQMNHRENQKIFNDPEYAIGELTYFSNSVGSVGVPGRITSPGHSSDVRFTYSVNLHIIETKYTGDNFNIPSSGPKIGERYLVIYQKTNPTNSRMLFDYLIKDSSDFVKYRATLKKNPLKLNWMYNAIIRSIN